jgi:hypothetical protein
LKILSVEGKDNIDKLFEGQDFIFKTLVVSFDGKKDYDISEVLNLPKDDYKAIDTALGKIINGEDFLADKKN